MWELEVALQPGQFESGDDVETMVQAFHQVHERVFAVSEPGQHIERIYWKGRATAHLAKPAMTAASSNGARPPEPAAVRDAWFGGQGSMPTRRDRKSLGRLEVRS